MPSRPAVAIFDVDSALLRGDSFAMFLSVAQRSFPGLVPGYMAARLCRVMASVLRIENKGNLYDLGLRWIVSRLSADQLAHVTDTFLDEVLQSQLRPGAIDHLIQRRKAGDRVILATSGFDFYVGPMAARLGGADVIASRTLASASGQVLAKLDGPLCTGAEKLARVKALFAGGRRPPFVRAYASNEDDFPLLAWADAGTAVNPKPALADEAQALGLAVVDWSFGAKDAPVREPRMPSMTSPAPSEHSKQR